MNRHTLDWLSLIAGLVLAALAVAFIVGAYADLAIEGGLLLALGLMAAGVVGLVGVVTSQRPRGAHRTGAQTPAASDATGDYMRR